MATTVSVFLPGEPDEDAGLPPGLPPGLLPGLLLLLLLGLRFFAG